MKIYIVYNSSFNKVLATHLVDNNFNKYNFYQNFFNSIRDFAEELSDEEHDAQYLTYCDKHLKRIEHEGNN